MKFVLRRIENFALKGENAGNQHCLFITPCFQKAFFSEASTVVYVSEEIKSQTVQVESMSMVWVHQPFRLTFIVFVSKI